MLYYSVIVLYIVSYIAILLVSFEQTQLFGNQLEITETCYS